MKLPNLLPVLITPGKDWSFPYYRDGAYCIGLGLKAREQLLGFLAKKQMIQVSGRQMLQHYGQKDLRIVTQSSPTGTQFLQAVGCAMARKKEKTKEVVYVHQVKVLQVRVIFMKH